MTNGNPYSVSLEKIIAETLASFTELCLKHFSKKNKSEEKFQATLEFIKTNRGILSRIASVYYIKQGYKLLDDNIPLLMNDSWFVSEPQPIDSLKLNFIKESPIATPHSYENLPYKGDYLTNLIKVMYCGNEEKAPYRDNICYRLVSYKGYNELTFSLCSYFNYINSCEYLLFDFTHQILVNHKPNRQLDPFDFSNRYMVPGINTLLVFLDEGESWMYLHKRSKTNVAEAINTKHVVPAGTFQPIHEDDSFHNQDFCFYTNIMREFGEELYSDKEIIHPAGSREDIFQRRSIRPYHHLLQRRLGKVYYLGFGLDCLTLKPEIISLMVYNKNDFESFFGGLNFKPNNEGKPFAVPFTKEVLREYYMDREMQPVAAGCMFYAYKFYDQIIKCLNTN
jgi:hypothetical protein